MGGARNWSVDGQAHEVDSRPWQDRKGNLETRLRERAQEKPLTRELTVGVVTQAVDRYKTASPQSKVVHILVCREMRLASYLLGLHRRSKIIGHTEATKMFLSKWDHQSSVGCSAAYQNPQRSRQSKVVCISRPSWIGFCDVVPIAARSSCSAFCEG